MNSPARAMAATAAVSLIKKDPTTPAFFVTDREAPWVKAGINFQGRSFEADTPISRPMEGLVVGSDYAVKLDPDGNPVAVKVTAIPSDSLIIGGFHFAPGGNAPARAGGDDVPAINLYSMWDQNFRFVGGDNRGMTFVESLRFWCDIYLTASDHLAGGTSQFGVTIADGNDPPEKPRSKKRYSKFDFPAAMAVMAHHGKGLLNVEESFAAYYGGTEKTARGSDPKITGLDAARTSKWGVHQPFGSMWTWGHDGDPDGPRPSWFGGAWWAGGFAGSRRAVVDGWAGDSSGGLGARGRGDHLQLG